MPTDDTPSVADSLARMAAAMGRGVDNLVAMRRQAAAAEDVHLGDMLRVLVVLAAPVTGTTPGSAPPNWLNLRAEWLKLADPIRKTPAPIALIRCVPPTLDALRAELGPQMRGQGLVPHVVHFSGHGWPGGLLFEDEWGRADPVPVERLVEIFRDAGVELFVANACSSAADAQAATAALVNAGAVKAAVGHLHPVADDTAIRLAAGLYRDLAQGGEPLGTAMAWAKATLAEGTGAERGIRPPPATPDTYNPQLLGDANLTLRPQPGGKSLVVDGRPPGVLSDGAGAFFGRGEQLVELAHLLADPDRRAIIISGVGGIGKSALALEASHRNGWRFGGGMSWVTGPRTEDAARVSTATSLLSQLCLDLGARVEPGADPAHVLLARCQAAPTLLLLDNLELLAKYRPDEVDGLAQFLAALPGGSKAIVTLRPPLPVLEYLQGATAFHLVDGLEQAPALAMAQRLARDHSLADKHGALLGELVRRVDGHPEIIRLAAGRLSWPGGAKGLAVEMQTLTGDLGKDLAKLVGWSADLLSEGGKAVLRLLPLFPAASCTEAAMSAALGEDVGSSLQELYGSGLLDYRQKTDRYVWHQSVMDYAMRLGGQDDSAAKLRLVAYYTEWGPEHLEDYAALAVEQPNLLPALEWAWSAARGIDEGERALGRAGVMADCLGMERFWWLRGDWALDISWLRRAIEAGETLTGEEERKQHASNLHSLAVTLAETGDYTAAEELCGRSAVIWEEIGDQQGLAATLHAQGYLAQANGDYTAAAELYRRSAAIDEELGDRQGLAATLNEQGRLAQATGDRAAAAELYRRSIAIEEEFEDRQWLAATLHQQATLAQETGDFGAAAELYRRSAAIREEIGDRQGLARTVGAQAVLASQQGRSEEAIALGLRSAAMLEEIGDRVGWAENAANLGLRYRKAGNLIEAEHWLAGSLQTLKKLGLDEALLKQGWKVREWLEDVRRRRSLFEDVAGQPHAG